MNYSNPGGFRAEIKMLREADDKDAFFTWFDGGGDTDGAFEKAEDIYNRLILAFAMKHLDRKRFDQMTSLDIGYGSGFQVYHASTYFGKAIGIDVHEEQDYVYDELVDRGGAGDIDLIVGDGESLQPIEDDSIDFVHSWCTFLHMHGIDIVKKYLAEIKRVLKPQGVAVIYFTRLIRSKSQQTESEYLADIAKEKEHAEGFRFGGPLTSVRSIGMIVSLWKMSQMAEESGLTVIDKSFSYDGKGKKKIIFGQHGLILRNDEPIVKEEKEETTPKDEQDEMSTSESTSSKKSSAKKSKKPITRKKK